MTYEMSRDEWRAFLLDEIRTAKVATTRADGSPHLAPVWFVRDGDDLVFTTDEHSVKGRTLQRDARVSICVDDERPPFAFVTLEGVAELSTDLAALRRFATAIGGRYMGADQAEGFGARNGVPGELLVRVHPTRVVARGAITD